MESDRFPDDIIHALSTIGRREQSASALCPDLEYLRSRTEFSRMHWSSWDRVTKSLPLDDVIALSKGLALVEAQINWGGGSVAPIIWVYREIERRDHNQADSLVEWVATLWASLGYANSYVRFVARRGVLRSRRASFVERRQPLT